MLTACYCHAMANLQVKALPDDLHDELRRRATAHGMTQRDYVIELIRRDLELTDKQAWFLHWSRRPPSASLSNAADVIRAGREERDAELTARSRRVSGH